MKALSLWQPWASLIAVGAKRIETRHWQCPQVFVGQTVAIHAAKRTRDLGLVDFDPFRRTLEAAKLDDRLVAPEGMPRTMSVRYMLPLGAIVATARIKRCAPITAEGATALRTTQPDEHAFGNYSLDEGPRWAWILDDVTALPVPLICEGAQGVFDVMTGTRRRKAGRRILELDELNELPALTYQATPTQR